MIGEFPPELVYVLDNEINPIALKAYTPKKMWDKKRDYEENTLIVDLRSLDPGGSLDQVKSFDSSTGRYISTVEVISGCLIVRLRREK